MNEASEASLTVEQKRVLLAKDVLEQMENGLTRPIKHKTLDIKFFQLHLEKSDENAQKFTKEQKCDVCAKGSLLMAYVRRFNSFTFSQLYTTVTSRWNDVDRVEKSALGDIFPPRMLVELEVLFECSIFTVTGKYIDSNEENYLIDFANNIPIDGLPLNDSKIEDRLRKLMNLLIQNEGRKLVLEPVTTVEPISV
jgi:hypothetical protein